MMARHYSQASRRLLLPGLVPLLSGIVLACTDSLGPIPTTNEVTVRVDVAEVVVWRADAGSYNISIPLTIINDSPRALFVNGFCFGDLERADGNNWTAVGPFLCDTDRRKLGMIPAETLATFGYGRGAGGPDPIVPDFAQPGTYRLRVRLWLDGTGSIRLPEDLGISNSFKIRD
jgi:hypothetical protein